MQERQETGDESPQKKDGEQHDPAVSKSVYKGVYKCGRKFKAQIQIDRVQHYLGLFDNEIEAAIAYDTHARIILGKRARTNFMYGGNLPPQAPNPKPSDATLLSFNLTPEDGLTPFPSTGVKVPQQRKKRLYSGLQAKRTADTDNTTENALTGAITSALTSLSYERPAGTIGRNRPLSRGNACEYKSPRIVGSEGVGGNGGSNGGGRGSDVATKVPRSSDAFLSLNQLPTATRDVDPQYYQQQQHLQQLQHQATKFQHPLEQHHQHQHQQPQRMHVHQGGAGAGAPRPLALSLAQSGFPNHQLNATAQSGYSVHQLNAALQQQMQRQYPTSKATHQAQAQAQAQQYIPVPADMMAQHLAQCQYSPQMQMQLQMQMQMYSVPPNGAYPPRVNFLIPPVPPPQSSCSEEAFSVPVSYSHYAKVSGGSKEPERPQQHRGAGGSDSSEYESSSSSNSSATAVHRHMAPALQQAQRAALPQSPSPQLTPTPTPTQSSHSAAITNAALNGGRGPNGAGGVPSRHLPAQYWAGVLYYDAIRCVQVWKGSWVNLAEGQAGQKPSPELLARSASQFEYISEVVQRSVAVAPDGSLLPQAGFFRGTYRMISELTGKFETFADRELYIEYESAEPGESQSQSTKKYCVYGSGDCQFGAFVVTGHYNALSSVMELTRQYISA